MLLLKLLGSFWLLITLSSCASYQLSDWQASLTLPASQDCFSVGVLSGKEVRLKASDPACIKKKQTAVWIDSANYKILKRDIQKNCQFNKCKQITGAFDELFFTIDHALNYINKR